MWQYAFLIVPGLRMPPEKSYPAVPCKWKGGYGYVVVYGADTLIYQPYIPAIGEKTAFTSEEDALKIGTLVCRVSGETTSYREPGGDC